MKLILLMVCAISISCKNNDIQNKLQKFINSEIIIPNNMDVFPDGCAQQFDGPKLVYFVDSIGCISCRLNHLFENLNILNESDAKCTVLPIIAPNKNNQEVLLLIREHNIHIPIYIDKENSFYKLNKTLPPDYKYHSFLLDKNNQVVLVGDPLASDAMWTLFKSTLDNMLAHGGVYVPEK